MTSRPARPRIPSTTYRLQFTPEFTFRHAREVVSYLHALGVSDVYASPFFQASPGSTHGYDVVDHNRLNAELGTPEDFEAYVAELKKFGLGQIADFVPNHMGIAEPTNTWWMDVLENGPSSVYAVCFDIDWHPLKEELENKVLLPILGDQYGQVLERGELKLSFEAGAFFVSYFQTKLPINPRTYGQVLAVALQGFQRQVSGTATPAPTIGPTAAGPVGEPASPEGYYLAELQSIMTALEHLPPRTETDPQKIAERAREKEVVKRRLARLCQESPPVQHAIDAALALFAGEPGKAHTFDRLDRLIEAQAYRLSFWRVAAEEINYRRFFDINTLAAIRMEIPEVFRSTHELLWRLCKTGAVTGLRIDHPDGLYDPGAYFRNLQENYAQACGLELPESGRAVYLLGEKILVGEEDLRSDWPVHGTTGYDFTIQVTGLLVDPDAERSFAETYKRFIDRNVNYPFLIYDKKRLVMRLSLANDINVLGAMLNRLSEHDRLYRDFTLNSLTSVVREVVACFPVYRTYQVPGQPVAPEDRRVIHQAVEAAKRRNPGMEASVFHFLRDVLLFEVPATLDSEGTAVRDHFVMKFQQCTSPIMAKGLEDTAFYIYNRLVALNEVGGEPDRFGLTPAQFHRAAQHRQQHWPHSMLASSTHDTKRSEDVRARVAALSELPTVWRQSLTRWNKLNAPHKTDVNGEQAPDLNEEYLIYQILLGTWPLGGELTPAENEVYVSRIQDYMTKAIKEAKVNTSWIQPNEPWDKAVRDFVAALLDLRPRNAFRRAFEPLAEQVARLGALNGLTQLILKLTVPGVPDIYQGNETWDFSLVDPDNRRPVDYHRRRQMLSELKGADARQLLHDWPDGRIKLFVTRSLLHHRQEAADVYRYGGYEPLPLQGRFADCALAFARPYAGEVLLVVVPRLTSRVGFPPVGEPWADTELCLQATPGKGPRLVQGTLRHVLTGEKVAFERDTIPMRELFADFPFGVYGR